MEAGSASVGLRVGEGGFWSGGCWEGSVVGGGERGCGGGGGKIGGREWCERRYLREA